jgi:hypothetical protein
LRRRPNRLYVTRAVEKIAGVAHNLMINAALIEKTSSATSVRDTARCQAASGLLGAPRRAANPAASLRGPLVCLSIALAAWVLFAWLTPKPIGPSLARMFGADLMAPTATQIDLLRPGPDETVYAGEPLTIAVRLRGRPADRLVFERLNPAAPTETLLRYVLSRAAGRREDDVRSLTLAAHEVTAPRLPFRVRAGDAILSGNFDVCKQPNLVDWWVKLQPPEYVSEPQRTSRERQIRAWHGTRALFAFRANTPVRAPVLALETPDGQTTRTRMSPSADDPLQAGVRLLLRQSGSFWFEFSDAHGRAFRGSERRRLIVQRDAPPEIQITTPTQPEAPDDLVDVSRFARLRAAASDDVALQEIQLVTARHGLEQRTPLFTAAREGRTQQIELDVPTDSLDVAIGEQVPCWFEASDNHVWLDDRAAPQRARSRTLVLTRTPEPPAPPHEDSAAAGEDAPSRPQPLAASRSASRRNGSNSPNGQGHRGPARDADPNGSYAPLNDPNAVPQRVIDGPANAEGERPDAGESSRSDEASEQFEQRLREFIREHAEELRRIRDRQGAEEPPGSEPSAEGGQPTTPEDSEDTAPPERPEGSPTDQAEQQSEQPRPDEAGSNEDQPDTEPQDRATEPGEPPRDTTDSNEPDTQEPSSASPAETGRMSEQAESDESTDDHGDAGAAASGPSDESPASDQPEATASGDAPGGGHEAGTDDSRGSTASANADIAADTDTEGIEQPHSDQAEAAGAAPRIDDMLTVLDLLGREQEPAESELVELGLTAERSLVFVRDFERLLDAARQAGIPLQPDRLKAALAMRADELRRQETAGRALGLDAVAPAPLEDALAGIQPPPGQQIGPDLAALLDAYYRSIAEAHAQETAGQHDTAGSDTP